MWGNAVRIITNHIIQETNVLSLSQLYQIRLVPHVKPWIPPLILGTAEVESFVQTQTQVSLTGSYF
jgi:hypothetical protein